MKQNGVLLLAVVAAVAAIIIFSGVMPFTVFFFPGQLYAGEPTHAVFNMPMSGLQNSPICNTGGAAEIVTTSYKITEKDTGATIKPEVALSPPTTVACILKDRSGDYPTDDDYWTPPYSDQPRNIIVSVWWHGITGVQLAYEQWEMIVLPARGTIPDENILITNREACGSSEIGNTRCNAGIPETCLNEIVPEGYDSVAPPISWQYGGDGCTPDQQLKYADLTQKLLLLLGVILVAYLALRSFKKI